MEQLSNHLHENNQNFNSNSQNIGNNAAHQSGNSNNSFSSAEEVVTEDTAAKEDSEEVDKISQKQLVSDPGKFCLWLLYGYFKAFGSSFEFMFSPVSHCIFPTDKYFEKIIELNDVAALKLNDGQQKEALSILYKAEKMLEVSTTK